MKLKKLLADKGHKKSGGEKRPKLTDDEKKLVKSGEKVLKRIRKAARKATEEFIKSRKTAEKEAVKRLKAARAEAARIAAEVKAAQEVAEEEEAAAVAAEEEAAQEAAEEECAAVAAEDEAAQEAAEEEAARIAAEEKAAKKAAKKQSAAEDAARWVTDALLALGDKVELNEEEALSAVLRLCEALDWKFLKNLTGCQIEYGTDREFSDRKKEKIKLSDELSALQKKFTAGMTYCVRARLCAAVKEKNRFSDWSEVLTLKA